MQPVKRSLLNIELTPKITRGSRGKRGDECALNPPYKMIVHLV